MNGNPKNGPQANIGRRFASPIKKGSDRTTRAIERQQTKRNLEVQSILNGDNSVSGGSGDPSSRISCLPQLQTVTESSVETAPTDSEPMTVLVGEQLLDNYRVIDLPNDPSTTEAAPSSADEGLVNTALLARIEFLEAECTRLQKSDRKQQHFGIDKIKHDDHLISFIQDYYIFIFLSLPWTGR